MYTGNENKILVFVFMKVLAGDNPGRSGIRGSNVGVVGFQLVVVILKVRAGVKSIKKIKGKAGKPDKIELIVNVDLVNISQLKHFQFFLQTQLNLSDGQLADLKEVFLLFDKDQDGVLDFRDLCFVIKTLGIRISGLSVCFFH